MNLSEKDLASQVEDLLEIGHWKWMHSRPARVMRNGRETYETAYSGHKGFTDYVAVRNGTCLFIELKSEKGKLSPEQQEWATELEAVAGCSLGVQYFEWRPSDFEALKEVLSEGGSNDKMSKM